MNEQTTSQTKSPKSIKVDSDTGTRKGVFADLALVSVNGSIARIDFISGDLPSDESIGAVLTSRVYMPLSALVGLRDQIEERIGLKAGTDVDHP